MKKIFILLIIIIFIPTVGLCEIIYIPNDYSTIQEGLNVAEQGDTIQVSAGTYTENIVSFR